MFILSTYLTLISFAILPVILLIAGVFFFKARRYFILMRRKVAAVTGHLNESISGMRIIKAFAVEDTDYKKFDTLTDAELAVNIKAQKLFAAIPAIVMVVIGFALGSIVLTGALLMQQNQIDAGTLIAFVLYLFNFMGPLVNVMNLFSQIQNSMAAGERIIKVIDTVPTVRNKPDAIELPPVQGAVDFNDVHFYYEKNIPIIKDLNLHIDPKETYCHHWIHWGRKNHDYKLLCRFYDIQEGSIKVDGYDLRDVTLRSLRSQIGLVLQDNFLFSEIRQKKIFDMANPMQLMKK